ncbi:hypothetical protein ANN_07052 [Periplaneta americana]|uniref:Uncharacterized protein n=1 Tax=Periplaneta americana TaxID=6978 RepID=A0ABQ8TGL1_PERAM|nr:hypothetical protein ANN_07052 [Periplaneta americana]
MEIVYKSVRMIGYLPDLTGLATCLTVLLLTGQPSPGCRLRCIGFLEYVPCQQRLQMWFMHNGTPAHSFRNEREHLTLTFQDRWIDWGGPTAWPARSSYLNPLDFWLSRTTSGIFEEKFTPATGIEAGSLVLRIMAVDIGHIRQHTCRTWSQATKGNIEGGGFGPVLWIEFGVAQWSERLVRRTKDPALSRAVASWSKAPCLELALRNARWFESSWEKKFSHEISASVWARCPRSIVMHLGSYDR